MTRAAVLHLTTFLQGGAGRAIADLAIGQHQRGRLVAVATSKTGAPGYGNYADYLDRLRAAGVPLVEADSSFSRNLPDNRAFADAVARAWPGLPFDLVHAHAATPALIGGLLGDACGRTLPIVQTMHGWGTSKTPEQAARDIGLLRQATRVVATSEASADDLCARGVPRNRMVTIPCGIDDAVPEGAGAGDARGGLRAQAAGRPVALCVGTVNANKNQRLIVEALPLLPDAGAPLVVFAGEGPDIAAVLERARVLGVADRVVALGYVPDAARLLPEADLVVQPSRSEGQGLAVLEAFRAGRPVVASDIPALRELVRDGDTGFLFADDDPAALARAMARTLTQSPGERARMAERAAALFRARYTRSAMLEAHDTLYDGMI